MSLEHIDGVVVEASGRNNSRRKSNNSQKSSSSVVRASVAKKGDGTILVQPSSESETLKYFKSVNKNAQKKADDAVNEPIAPKLDEVVGDLEKERREKKERDEKSAKTELGILLESVFPQDCKDKEGQSLPKRVLIERFLNEHPNAYKLLLQRSRRKKDLKGEIGEFFVNLYDSGELSGGEDERDRIRKHFARYKWKNLRDQINQAKDIESILEITRKRSFPIIEWDFVDRDPEYIRSLLEEVKKNPSVESIEKLPTTFDLRRKVKKLYPSLFTEEKKEPLETKDVKDVPDGRGENVQEDAPREGFFGAEDYKETLDDEANKKELKRIQKDFDEETEHLKTRDRLAERFRDVKSFDELLVLLNDPEFPGIQGSQQFYSGEDLRRIVAGARETGATNFVIRSRGFLETVERLLRQEKEGKIGAIKEDGIAEGFGVVSEPALEIPVVDEMTPEVVIEEGMADSDISKEKGINGIEAVRNGIEGEEKTLEGEYIPKNESLDARIEELEKEISERRREYGRLAYQKNTAIGRLQKAGFRKFFSGGSEIEKELVESRDRYFATRKALESAHLDRARSLAGSSPQKIKEELVGTLKRFGITESIDLYNDFLRAKFSGGVFEKWMSRSAKWVDDYRKMPFLRKAVLTTLIVGGSALAFGAEGATTAGNFLRGGGSTGAGVGVVEASENIANTHFIKKKENEESYATAKSVFEGDEMVDGGKIALLRRALEIQSGAVEKNFNSMRRWRRARVAGGMAVTAGLFFGAPMASRWVLEHTPIRELAGSAFHGFEKLLEQVKSITGFEGFHSAPVSVSAPSSVESIPLQPKPFDVSPPSSGGAPFLQSKPFDVPSSSPADSIPLQSKPFDIPSSSSVESVPLQPKPFDVPLPPKPSVDVNSFLAHADQNVENARHAFPDMIKGLDQSEVFLKGGDAVVPKGSSIQGTLIEHFRKLGFSDADAGKFASRVSDAFQKDHPNVNLGKVFENTKIHFGPSPGSSGPLSAPFKIEGIEFAPSGPHGTSTVVGTMMNEKPATGTLLQPKPFEVPSSSSVESIPLQPKPFDVPISPSTETVSPASFPQTPLEVDTAPSDVFEKFLPPKISIPSLEDTLKGNVPLDVPTSVPNVESIPEAVSNIQLGTTPEDVLAKALPPEPAIIRESQDFLQENFQAPISRYQELLPYFHGVFDHVLISNPEKIALQNIFLAGESLNGRPPTTALIEKTQEKLFGVLFPGKEMATLINESTTTIPKQFGSDSAAMRHFEAAYGALKTGYSDGQRLSVSDKPIGEWLRDVTVHILKNPMRFEE